MILVLVLANDNNPAFFIVWAWRSQQIMIGGSKNIQRSGEGGHWAV